MFLSFFKRLFSRSTPTPEQIDDGNPSLKIFVVKEGGKYFQDFKLFHYDNKSVIDTLLFLPHYGIFFAETLNWKASDLENATVERSSIRSKRPSATHLESFETKIRSKLQDVLSFDFTPVYRFIRMDNLSESEFDNLDPSFHKLLPKQSIIFNTDTVETIKTKLSALGEYLSEPLSSVQIIGALQTYSYLLPTSANPLGALLSPQQNQFLFLPLDKKTTLHGNYGSGKSNLLVRKAMIELLNNPQERIVVFAPTLIASELLRNTFVSLMYHGVISIDFNRVVFSPTSVDLESFKPFNEATIIMCDDAYAMDQNFIHLLTRKISTQKLLTVAIDEDPSSQINYPLMFTYRQQLIPFWTETTHQYVRVKLLSELRKHINNKESKVLIIIPHYDFISLKESIDEYLGSNCRILIPSFTLQTQDIDDIIITTEEMLSGISASHVIIITEEPSKDYTYALSRGSETATIISVSNPKGDEHE